ncbi:leucyl aminopeptidase [Candidatus Woesearchaeota archaeon]|nr:leucyl aminopeptidase [Candidatus Woesearchaeota archaeon]
MNQTASVITAKVGLAKAKDSALLIGFFKDKTGLNAELSELDKEYGNAVSSYIKGNSFKGDKGEIKSIYANKGIKNIVLVGLGEEEKYGLDVLSNTIADASKRMRDSKTENFSIFLESFKGRFREEDCVEKAALGILMGVYQFTEYKTKDKDKIKKIRQATIISNSGKTFDNEIKYASAVADAVNKTRDLINTPPNVATPEYVAGYAKEIAKKSNLKCTIFDEKQIESMKMGCFIGVSQGSINKPRMIVLEYYGAAKTQKPIAIVGKGVTFDSGGLNLKPYPYILNMKDDKGGAVAAMHIIEACARLRLAVNIIVITPLCENMPSGTSFRPDDVLKAYNGTTVEIKNTDAEGRLILADALSYAAEKKPQAIIDIATLTGASLIVLGYAGTPFVCTDESLRKRLNNASAKSLEKLWELPLWQEYEDSLKSDVADVKHIGDEGEAGVITASMFLKNFVGDIPWAHIDIGTTVWSKVDKGILTKGATGATVRLLMEMMREWK